MFLLVLLRFADSYQEQCRAMSARCRELEAAYQDSSAGLEGHKALELVDELTLYALRLSHLRVLTLCQCHHPHNQKGRGMGGIEQATELLAATGDQGLYRPLEPRY